MPAAGWPYMILNLGLPDSHVILRKNLERVKKDGKTHWQDTGDNATYQHPFTDFPVIYSHVHPCFVVLNAYDKLKNLRKYPAHWLPEQQQCAQRVVSIASMWFRHAPPKDFQPDPRLTADMRRLNIRVQDEIARDAEEGDVGRLATPPPEDEPLSLAAPLLARGGDGEERPESSSGSEQSTPSRKRPAAGPSRRPTNASRKRGPGPSRGR